VKVNVASALIQLFLAKSAVFHSAVPRAARENFANNTVTENLNCAARLTNPALTAVKD